MRPHVNTFTILGHRILKDHGSLPQMKMEAIPNNMKYIVYVIRNCTMW